MTLGKAIEILSGSTDKNIPYSRREIKAAQKLGIEALKRINGWRKGTVTQPGRLLSGETGEGEVDQEHE